MGFQIVGVDKVWYPQMAPHYGPHNGPLVAPANGPQNGPIMAPLFRASLNFRTIKKECYFRMHKL